MTWAKLEEYAYQLFLDGEVFIPAEEDALHQIMGHLQEDAWMYSEEDNIPLVESETEQGEGFVRYRATEPARDLMDVIFQDYQRIFMD